MFDEPHIYRDNYMQAEVLVLANSQEEALGLLREDDKWDIDELKRIQPIIVSLDRPCVVGKLIYFG
jgi:hypothetical protein